MSLCSDLPTITVSLCHFPLQQIIYRWKYIWQASVFLVCILVKGLGPVSYLKVWNDTHFAPHWLLASCLSAISHLSQSPSLAFLHVFLWLWCFGSHFFNWRTFHFKSDGEGTGHEDKGSSDKFWKMLTSIRNTTGNRMRGWQVCVYNTRHSLKLCGTHLVK